ncbi:MAG: putative S-adenosyl-L-methionine-dependent methyltransferase MraW [Actinomycetota bacterium]
MKQANPPKHVPVMLERCITLLAPAISRPNAVVLDATLGLAGHSLAMLEQFPNLRLVGIDRDENALAISRERLAAHSSRITLVHAVYDEISDVLAELGIPAVDGVLFDLGVSSMQLDVAERGFSYNQDSPLDMRMNNQDNKTAAEILNTYSHGELARIISHFGEEKFAGKIASAIIKAREVSPIQTSVELVELIKSAIPAAARRTGGNPAKRTFQALRIEVNSELSVLERAMPQALSALNAGGRVVVLSYHSLEDKIVKDAFAKVSTSSTPIDLPIDPVQPDFKLLVRGNEKPTDDEVAENPRARSVRLRAIEKVVAA